MLSNLHIENIAVIENVDIDFSEGFNVLTGETGAGKSIIIDSLNAVLGKRTSKDIVRAGCNKGFVSALFTDVCSEVKEKLIDLGFADEQDDTDCVLLQRVVSVDGKGSYKINTRPATAAVLKEIGKYLIDIHGQSDNQFLLNPLNYYRYIDKLADNTDIYNSFISEYNKFKVLFKQRKNLLLSEDEKKSRITYLSSVVDELSKADIKTGEREQLLQRQAVVQNSEKILNSVNITKTVLSGDVNSDGILTAITDLLNSLSEVSSFDKEISSVSERINSCYYELEEVLNDTNKIVSKISYDYSEAEAIEERLDLIYKLTKKYNLSADELCKYYTTCKSELNNLVGDEKDISKLDLELESQKNKTINMAVLLSESRKNAAKKFEQSVISEMKYLDMPYARFEVVFNTKSLDSLGFDDIDFYISVNPGEEPKSLSETASGGELSRIMLSIKNVLSKFDFVETMIFDEIDSGTSGKAASKIGNKLKIISADKQVICITHLAQIAAVADTHLLVKKQIINDRTVTNVIQLDINQRYNELARIMGGETITKTTLSAARELLGIDVDI